MKPKPRGPINLAGYPKFDVEGGRGLGTPRNS